MWKGIVVYGAELDHVPLIDLCTTSDADIGAGGRYGFAAESASVGGSDRVQLWTASART